MTKKQYQHYSPEFKIHALKRASEEGMTDVRVCEELGVSTRVPLTFLLRNYCGKVDLKLMGAPRVSTVSTRAQLGWDELW